jgi:hypothetical protein
MRLECTCITLSVWFIHSAADLCAGNRNRHRHFTEAKECVANKLQSESGACEFHVQDDVAYLPNFDVAPRMKACVVPCKRNKISVLRAHGIFQKAIMQDNSTRVLHLPEPHDASQFHTHANRHEQCYVMCVLWLSVCLNSVLNCFAILCKKMLQVFRRHEPLLFLLCEFSWRKQITHRNMLCAWDVD